MTETKTGVTIHNLQRIFKYDKVNLPDPDPKKSPEEVREFYSHRYPELTQAIIEGPEYEKERAVYTFTRAVGNKGGKTQCDCISKTLTLKELAEKGFDGHLEPATRQRKEETCITLSEGQRLCQILESGFIPTLPRSIALQLLP